MTDLANAQGHPCLLSLKQTFMSAETTVIVLKTYQGYQTPTSKALHICLDITGKSRAVLVAPLRN